MSEIDVSDIASVTASHITVDPGDTGSVFDGRSTIHAPHLTNRSKRTPKGAVTKVTKPVQAQLAFSMVGFSVPDYKDPSF